MTTSDAPRPRVVTRTLKKTDTKPGVRKTYNVKASQPVAAIGVPEPVEMAHGVTRARVNVSARRVAGQVREVHEAIARSEPFTETSVDRAVRNAKDGTINLEDAFPEPPPESPESYRQEFEEEQREARFEDEKLRDERSYRREYQLRTVHRMALMNFSNSEIARKLNVTYSIVHSLKEELYRRQRYEAKKLDGMYFIGKGLSTIREVQALAFRMAADPRTAAQHKVGAMMAMLASVNTEKRFVESFGFQDQHKYTPPADTGTAAVEKGRRDLDILVDLSARINRGEDVSKYEASSAEEEQTEGETFDDGITFC